MTDAQSVPEVSDQLPSGSSDARRSVLIRLLVVGGYLFVVFGILLPRVVDYGDMVDAFRDVPIQWLLVIILVGMFSWVAEGLALQAPMPGLSVRRSIMAYLSLAAIGSTMTGAVKLAVGYRIFREWGRSPEATVLGLTINGIASQAGKLLLPAIAFLLLAIAGTVPSTGFLYAFLLAVPIVLGIMVGIWMMRSEAFARRVGAFATTAAGSVMRRMHRPEPGDLTDRLLTFREAAKDLLLARITPITLTQLLARSVGYVLLLLSLRAVGVGADILPPDVILGYYAAVMVITLLPIAPGGAGLPEVLYIGFFTGYVTDPAWDDAIAAGVMLFRAMTWFVPIPVGYLALLFQRRGVAKERARAEAAGEPAPAGAIAAEDPSRS
jgi:putative heme transporter